jgi:hypothetical protein
MVFVAISGLRICDLPCFPERAPENDQNRAVLSAEVQLSDLPAGHNQRASQFVI